MIKKETHPEIFKKKTDSFNKAYANDPNNGLRTKNKDKKNKRIFSK